MGRRILNRKDMRADFDAAERRKEDEERDEDEDEDEDEEGEGDEEGDEDEEEGDEDEGDEGDVDDEAGDEDDEEKPRKKKKKVKEKVVTEPKKRTRAAKVVRQRVVWGVFSNSNQCVATYEYPRKAEAEQHAARLMQDKKSTHFVQPVKEPWEDREKKEK